METPSFEELRAREERGDEAAASAMIALAEHDNADACFAVGEYRLLGLHGPRNLEEAYRLISRAADAGHEEALRTRAYWTARGIGRDADWNEAVAMLEAIALQDRFVAVQLEFLRHLTCERKLATVERKVISTNPYIVVLPGLFSPAECRYLQVLASPWMQKAMVVDPQTGKGKLDPIRDADATEVVPVAEDLVVQSINRCIATATATRPGWGEPLGILRYRPGQQYRPHHDAFQHDNPHAKRQLTALVWLNEDYEGGETHFPELKLTIRGAIGDMLVFSNLTGDMEPDPRMKHAGLPVTKGEKWLASRWIRSTDYLAAS